MLVEIDGRPMYDTSMAATGTNLRRSERRYGEDLSRSVRVRLPPETDAALRRVRRLFGISVSEQIRMGIERSLADMVPKVAEIIQRDGTSNTRKLRLIDFLHSMRRSFLATHDPPKAKTLRDGLKASSIEQRRKSNLRNREASRTASPTTQQPS